MPTEDTVEKIETDLKAILARLTAEAEAAKGLAVEIKKLDEDADMLDAHITDSQKDIAAFMEEQGKELNTIILAEEQN